MSNKVLKLVIKGGSIHAIYDDALVPLMDDASVTTRRASHVEPEWDGRGWMADMSPVDGPLMNGFKTREAALSAERYYLDQYYMEKI